MGPDGLRCSTRSRDLGEELAGTASTVRRWLLLEQPGPWGSEALLESRLPDGVGPRLAQLADRAGVRALLIRRHGRGATSARRTCLVASSTPQGGWVERTRLDAVEDVLDLDFAALTRGEPLGLQPVQEPVFLVCTHGRHDPCCAERGRPVAEALSGRFPEQTWESSHLGGDRFAGNLLCLPHGLYFGRLSAAEALHVGQGYAEGRLDLSHFRGRSCYPWPVQAAEAYLRSRLDLHDVDELSLVRQHRSGTEVAASFTRRGGTTYDVRVRTTPAAPERALTCTALERTRPPAYELVDISTR